MTPTERNRHLDHLDRILSDACRDWVMLKCDRDRIPEILTAFRELRAERNALIALLDLHRRFHEAEADVSSGPLVRGDPGDDPVGRAEPTDA